MKQHGQHYDVELNESEPDDVADHVERVKQMRVAFRRAPSLTVQEWEGLKRRFRAWQEQRLVPFVSVLADIVLRSLGVET